LQISDFQFEICHLQSRRVLPTACGLATLYTAC
jgi:hypothetical protein